MDVLDRQCSVLFTTELSVHSVQPTVQAKRAERAVAVGHLHHLNHYVQRFNHAM